MRRYLFARSLLLTQTWAIVAFALTDGESLTGALLNQSTGGVFATALMAGVSLFLTVECVVLMARSRPLEVALIGPAYMLIAGLLLVQMYVMSVQGYYGPLFWLYFSLAVHSARLAWLLSHPVSTGQ